MGQSVVNTRRPLTSAVGLLVGCTIVSSLAGALALAAPLVFITSCAAVLLRKP